MRHLLDDNVAASAADAAWNWEKAILVGYPFGVDILPIVYDRLPAGLKGKTTSDLVAFRHYRLTGSAKYLT